MSAPDPSRAVHPWMVVAFEGWNDAAEAASGVVDHLIAWWDAELVAEIDPEDYYDFQVNRPHVSRDATGDRIVTWPTTRLYSATPAGLDREVLLLRGIEPNVRWRSFCEEILTLADVHEIATVVTLGALLADTPHTRPVPLSGTTSDVALGESFSLEESMYEGPTGINGVLADLCTQADVPHVSLWAAVPHYVAQAPCPKATLALLSRLEDLLGTPLPVGDLAEAARAWERGVEELASEDTEIAEYVEALEQAQDTSDLPEASGDAIAREFERYLRRRDGGAGPAGS